MTEKEVVKILEQSLGTNQSLLVLVVFAGFLLIVVFVLLRLYLSQLIDNFNSQLMRIKEDFEKFIRDWSEKITRVDNQAERNAERLNDLDNRLSINESKIADIQDSYRKIDEKIEHDNKHG